MSDALKEQLDDPLTKEGLGTSFVRGTAFTFLSQGGRSAIGIVSMVALARLLVPSDFGVVAMVAAFTGLVTQLKDMGLSAAAIQAKTLSHEQASNLFWANVITCTALAAGVSLAAPAVASYFRDPRVLGAAVVASLSVLLGGLGLQQMALLRRSLQFRKVMDIQLIAALANLLVSVTLAAAGFKYYSILLGISAATACESALSWRATKWRPSRPSRRQGTRRLLSYGGYVSGANLLNYVARNLDNVIIGRMADATTLGIYTRAYALLLLPLQRIAGPMSAVALPTLARLQTKPGAYRQFYSGAVELTAFVMLPAAAFGAVAAPEIVRVALGEKWLAVVPIFRLLVPAALFGTTYFMAGWVFHTLGLVRRLFLVRLATTGLLVLAMLVGSRWGVVGIAAAVSLHATAIFLPNLYFCFRGTFLSIGVALRALARPALATSVAAAGAFLVPGANGGFLAALGVLLLRTAVFGLLYVATWLAMPNGRGFLLRFREFWRGFRTHEGDRAISGSDLFLS